MCARTPNATPRRAARGGLRPWVRLFRSGRRRRCERIAAQAGVGVGTFYRHFLAASPTWSRGSISSRSRRLRSGRRRTGEVEHEPGEALASWLRRYTSFIGTKRGLAAALHSGDHVFRRAARVFPAAPRAGAPVPALRVSGGGRSDPHGASRPTNLLHAVANVVMPHGRDHSPAYGRPLDRWTALRRLRSGVGSPSEGTGEHEPHEAEAVNRRNLTSIWGGGAATSLHQRALTAGPVPALGSKKSGIEPPTS